MPRMRNAHRDTALPIRDIPELHPHELRHTAASLASGADVKVVQQMLGRSSAAMTIDSGAVDQRWHSLDMPAD